MKVLVRVTTVPQSLGTLLRGQLRHMNENGFEVVGISSPGKILNEVAQHEGIRVIPVEMTRTISPLKDLKAVWRLYKIFRKEKPFIVHTHTPKAGTVGLLAAKLAGVPNRLHTVAGLPLLVTKGKKRKLLDYVEKKTYSWATKVYPNSFGLYDIILTNSYTDKDKLKVLANGSSNGIDTTFFSPDHVTEAQKTVVKKKLGVTQDNFIFVFVGRMVKDKGINELVSAFQKLNAQFPHAKLILVGEYEKHLDPLTPEIEAVIENHKNIISVGYQNDVRPYFAIADTLVFPSYREGFPNVVMQAASLGINSIVTDINGCNEIITDGLNGLIIPPQDEQTLYEKMKFLVQNPIENRRLAGNARQTIIERYEQRLVWQALLEEYRGCLAESL